MAGGEAAGLERTPEPGCFRLHGALAFSTVNALQRQAETLLDEPRVRVDLAAIERVDSAGLALLIEWTRRARALDGSIEFVNMPAQLMKIARLSGLDGILPFKQS